MSKIYRGARRRDRLCRMRPVVFVAPFAFEATLRFARAVAALPDVRLCGLMQEPPAGEGARLFDDIVKIDDGLSARSLIEGVDVLRRRHGPIHRIVGVLEPLQVQLAQVRAHFGIHGTNVEVATVFRDKALMKERLRAAGLPTARHRLVTNANDALGFEREVGYPMVVKPPS